MEKSRCLIGGVSTRSGAAGCAGSGVAVDTDSGVAYVISGIANVVSAVCGVVSTTAGLLLGSNYVFADVPSSSFTAGVVVSAGLGGVARASVGGTMTAFSFAAVDTSLGSSSGAGFSGAADAGSRGFVCTVSIFVAVATSSAAPSPSSFMCWMGFFLVMESTQADVNLSDIGVVS
ncbi:hypothetical protein ACOSQ2_003341 [Xanthoceras sorbifolium]